MEGVAREVKPEWKPDVEFFEQALGFRVGNYGMTKWSDLFTKRQLVALTTFSDLAQEASSAKRNALAAGVTDDGKALHDGGTEATAYADAVAAYLGLAVGKFSDNASALCSWHNGAQHEKIRATYGRQSFR